MRKKIRLRGTFSCPRAVSPGGFGTLGSHGVAQRAASCQERERERALAERREVGKKARPRPRWRRPARLKSGCPGRYVSVAEEDPCTAARRHGPAPR